jgi:hypothetical protein
MPPSTKRVQIALLAFACAGGISCHRMTAHAAPPAAGPQPAENSQPATPAPSGLAAGGNSAPANTPSKNAATESAPAATPAPKPVEPKPRPVTPTPAPPVTETPAPKPAPPQISPRISPAQEAELKSQTQRSIAEAEANLRRTAGRQLSDIQRDMVEKIQSFLNQSREASEVPDWSRARILADKARVLSVELVESL